MLTLRRTLITAGTATATLSLLAVGAAAQEHERAGRFVLAPYVGVYVPTGDLAKVDQNLQGLWVGTGIKQTTGPVLGATGNYWLSDRFALELGAGYVMTHANSDFAFTPGGGGVTSSRHENSHVFLGTAKIMMSLFPETSPARLRFGFGPAIISRGGSAYNSAQGKVSGLTNLGANLSLCTRLLLTENLALRLRGESYLYQSHLKYTDASNSTNDFTFDRKLQNDFVFSAGFQMAIGR